MTGAGGFLGTHVVAALRRRGHEVRALVRPAAAAAFPSDVEIRRADLRVHDLEEVVGGADAVVHLAAKVEGSEEARFAGSVVATERLLAAASAAGVRRLVLASSYAVYDWSRAGRAHGEDAPIEGARMYERDGYAIAKLWQERAARAASDRGEIELTVLRPGYVWGAGRALVAGVGQRVDGVLFVIGPRGRLPLTYVENCADCFAVAVETPRAIGETLNVIDRCDVSTWRYARDHVRRGAAHVRLVPIPYHVAFACVRAGYALARLVLGERPRLPSILVPRRFEARFRTLPAGPDRLREVLHWSPPFAYRRALERAYGEQR